MGSVLLLLVVVVVLVLVLLLSRNEFHVFPPTRNYFRRDDAD